MKKIILDFVDAINRHDVERLYTLMAEDFRFVDAYGGVESGRDTMKKGWEGYFRWFPDYTIEVVDLYERDDRVAFFGYASGTYEGRKTETNENYWRLPAAWQAVIEEDKVKLWQVCCDSKIPYEIIGRFQ